MPRKAAVTHYQCAPAQAPSALPFYYAPACFSLPVSASLCQRTFLEGHSAARVCYKLEFASPRSSIEQGSGYVCPGFLDLSVGSLCSAFTGWCFSACCVAPGWLASLPQIISFASEVISFSLASAPPLESCVNGRGQ